MLSTIVMSAAAMTAGLQTGSARPADPYSMHVIVTTAARQLSGRSYSPWRVNRAVPRSPVLSLELEMVAPVTETFWAEMEQRLTLWQCSTDATAILAGGGRIEILVEDPILERSQRVTLTRCPG